jgi:hypothetical protein
MTEFRKAGVRQHDGRRKQDAWLTFADEAEREGALTYEHHELVTAEAARHVLRTRALPAIARERRGQRCG